MKKHNFPIESFIAGWYIDPEICDGLIQLFKDNKKRHKQGVIGGPWNVNKEKKNSIDLGIHPAYDEPRFMAYRNALGKCTGLYQEIYPEDHDLTSLSNWGEFEEEHPSTFKGMYQFWAQK